MKNSITYLSREFRDNLGEAFQNALEGKTVIIKRFNRKFILVPEKKIKQQEKIFKDLESRVDKLEKALNA